MIDAVLWVLSGMWSGVAGLFYVLTHPVEVFDLSNSEAVLRVVYYGASSQLFFVFFDIVLGLFIVGLFRRDFLWGVVRGLEGFANGVGRIAAWAGLLMVLQQTLVVLLQSIFRVSEISVGPFGLEWTKPVAWYGDSLKFYNAIIVCMCCAWTFVQGGHVRVDLFYAGVKHRTKRIVDMFGALLFMMPAMLLTWFYAWFFLWRHLITPPVSSSDPLDRMLLKARAMRWNVETTGFSPNGFDAYFLFKVLILVFCLMMLIQAVAFFFRSFLEYVEGQESAGRYHDQDVIDPGEIEMAAPERLAHGDR